MLHPHRLTASASAILRKHIAHQPAKSLVSLTTRQQQHRSFNRRTVEVTTLLNPVSNIGSSNSKNAASASSSIAQKTRGHKSSFLSALPFSSKATIKETNVMTEAAKAITPPPVAPTLERQLTSNFDREFDITDDNASRELNDTDLDANSDHGLDDLINEENAKLEAAEQPGYMLCTGEATDIGGGHENQDKAMCFRTGPNKEHLVMAVFDGHGRELGELAAIIARDYMQAELKKNEVIQKVISDPTKYLEAMFEAAHHLIKDRFKQHLSRHPDFEVYETDEGYLVKRQRKRASSSNLGVSEVNVHGGTTATMVIVLDSSRVVIANVGDSTALFGGVGKSGSTYVKELSAEHSPESGDEFLRIRDTRSASNGEMPELKFVFDVIDRYPNSTPKHACPPIFSVAAGNRNEVTKQTTGFYYKNVRSEWATLVTTPPTARFQDALAFTRSLGDLHLHVYGVSYVPEVRETTLADLFGNIEENEVGVFLVCTDGVWDNWKYEEIMKRTARSSLVKDVVESRSAQAMADEMMQENKRLAKQHFGSQADNMTGIICVVKPL